MGKATANEKTGRDMGFWIVFSILTTVILSMCVMLTGSAESHIGTPAAIPVVVNPTNANNLFEGYSSMSGKKRDGLSIEERIKNIVMMRVEVARICQEILEHDGKPRS